MTPRVRALRRKMVLAHAEIVLRGLAADFCQEWSIAQAGNRPLPDIFAFIRQISAAGFRLPTTAYAHRYLERCQYNGTEPQPRMLLKLLLPWRPVSDYGPGPDSPPSDTSG